MIVLNDGPQWLMMMVMIHGRSWWHQQSWGSTHMDAYNGRLQRRDAWRDRPNITSQLIL